MSIFSRFITLSGGLVLAGTCLGFMPAVAAPEKPAVKIAYASMSGAFGSLWVADAMGYFKQEGLDVELLYTQTTIGLQAMTSGHLDVMATGCAEFFEANRKGYGNRIIANVLEDNLYMLATAKNVTKPDQLIGKAIAVNSIGDTSYLSLRYVLRRANIDPNKVTYVEMGSTPERFSALARGSVAGATQSVSLRPLVEKNGLNILMDLHQMKIPSCLGAIGVRADFIKKYPETVTAILRAIVKGNAYLGAGPAEETKKIFSKYMRMPVDNESLVQGWQFFSREGHYRSPIMTIVAARTVMDMMAEQDPAWKNEKPEAYVDLQPMQAVEDSGYLDQVYKEIGVSPKP